VFGNPTPVVLVAKLKCKNIFVISRERGFVFWKLQNSLGCNSNPLLYFPTIDLCALGDRNYHNSVKQMWAVSSELIWASFAAHNNCCLC